MTWHRTASWDVQHSWLKRSVWHGWYIAGFARTRKTSLRLVRKATTASANNFFQSSATTEPPLLSKPSPALPAPRMPSGAPYHGHRCRVGFVPWRCLTSGLAPQGGVGAVCDMYPARGGAPRAAMSPQGCVPSGPVSHQGPCPIKGRVFRVPWAAVSCERPCPMHGHVPRGAVESHYKPRLTAGGFTLSVAFRQKNPR